MSKEIKVPSIIPNEITVNLTESNIWWGQRCSQTECPFALAFATAGFPTVRVGAIEAAIVINGERYYYENPPDVCYMIKEFDSGFIKEMKPGTYTFKKLGPTKLLLGSWDAE